MSAFLHDLGVLAQGIGATFIVTVSAFLLGAVIAVPTVVCRTSGIFLLRAVATAYIEVARGIPPIAWLFVLYFGLTQLDVRLPSLTAAIIGLGLIAGGYLAEIYRSGLRAVPAGQSEAAASLGISRFVAYTKVIVPQAIVTVVPLAATYMIGLLKDSAVASVIGAQEITSLALSLSRREVSGLTVFVAAGVVYLVISVPVALLGRGIGSVLVRRLEVR